MNRFKLTPLGKLVIFVVFALIVGVVGYFGGAFDQFLGGKVNVGLPVSNNSAPASADVMQLSLDEWIGWKPILDANGGIDTASGSIFDKLGLKVHINIIGEADKSSTALIQGSLHAAGYTINRLAFLYPKFRDNNCPVKMLYITNTSTGGDGIIAKAGINRIEDLVGKKVGVPRYSEAQTLIEWFLAKSSLTDSQVAQIRRNFKYFNSPEDAAKACFAGQVDAAATWQPYLSQAQTMGTYHVLFDTKAATNLIIDGVVFRADFAAQHPDMVQKFIEGSLQAAALYNTNFGPIKNVMPMFATESDESIKAMAKDATLSNYADNASMLTGAAKTLYRDMCTVWTALNEKADPSAVDQIFETSAIAALAPKFPNSTVTKVSFTEAQRQEAKANDTALMTLQLSINFETGSAMIKPESKAQLDELAGVATLMNGVVLQIEGNTDNIGDPAANKDLSEKRAKAVKIYLQYNKIDPTRFVIIGNGQDKPTADNGTDEGRAKNRRTDVYFKVVK